MGRHGARRTILEVGLVQIKSGKAELTNSRQSLWELPREADVLEPSRFEQIRRREG